MPLNDSQNKILTKILSKTGDLNFKRRIITMLEYLDIMDGESVLDMGCGEGFYSMIFSELYKCKVTAVDYDNGILSQARDRLKGRQDITIESGDVCKLRYPDNTFDKIVCTEVLEHIDDDVTAVRELGRVLKPGGVLAVTVPNKNYPLVWDPLNKIRESLGLGHFNPLSGFWGGIWAYAHKRLYLPSELKELLESAPFEVTDLRPLTHYGLPFNHLILYTGKQLYTKMPVPEGVKQTMEKFDWKEDTESSSSLLGKLISVTFDFFKIVDSLNDRKFDMGTSTMAVAARCIKK